MNRDPSGYANVGEMTVTAACKAILGAAIGDGIPSGEKSAEAIVILNNFDR